MSQTPSSFESEPDLVRFVTVSCLGMVFLKNKYLKDLLLLLNSVAIMNCSLIYLDVLYQEQWGKPR